MHKGKSFLLFFVKNMVNKYMMLKINLFHKLFICPMTKNIYIFLFIYFFIYDNIIHDVKINIFHKLFILSRDKKVYIFYFIFYF